MGMPPPQQQMPTSVRPNPAVQAQGGTGRLGGSNMASIMGVGAPSNRSGTRATPMNGTGRLGGGSMAAVLGGGGNAGGQHQPGKHGEPLHFRSGLNSLYGPPPSTAEIRGEKSKSQKYADELKAQVDHHVLCLGADCDTQCLRGTTHPCDCLCYDCFNRSLQKRSEND